MIEFDTTIALADDVDRRVTVSADCTPTSRGTPRTLDGPGTPDQPGEVEIVGVIEIATGRDLLDEIREYDARQLTRPHATGWLTLEERLMDLAIERACAA